MKMIVLYLLRRPLVPLTSDMSQHDSGLRVTTARSSEAVDKAADEEQPGSAVFYSPSASQDASPAGKSAFRMMFYKAPHAFQQLVSPLDASKSAFCFVPFKASHAFQPVSEPSGCQ